MPALRDLSLRDFTLRDAQAAKLLGGVSTCTLRRWVKEELFLYGTHYRQVSAGPRAPRIWSENALSDWTAKPPEERPIAIRTLPNASKKKTRRSV
ncbi:hypothetical protein [Anthocerotibacter panamensis]|uniref:hypothetical protein n=1 Tax=Anthocerotibacter panamensis TaxID=2857077 RepID=UPI001C405D8A|nr:hypothetical protein [Anthocerotibacter panamensis]